MRTGSTVIRVVENPAGGWDIREPGNTEVSAHSADLDGAVLKARTMMVNGGAVRIVNGEGFLVETRTVPAPGGNPWWYSAPRLSTWVLGGLFVLQGVFGTVIRRGDGTFFWMHVVMGLLGAAYIVQLLVSRAAGPAVGSISGLTMSCSRSCRSTSTSNVQRSRGPRALDSTHHSSRDGQPVPVRPTMVL